jgi:hypothetical protein
LGMSWNMRNKQIPVDNLFSNKKTYPIPYALSWIAAHGYEPKTHHSSYHNICEVIKLVILVLVGEIVATGF